MEYTLTTAQQRAHVIMTGRFTFSDNQKFKVILDTIRTPSEPIHSIDIDVSRLEFIDSAGLGMLLLLKDESSARNLSVSLIRPTGQVEKMFELSRFQNIFNVVYP